MNGSTTAISFRQPHAALNPQAFMIEPTEQWVLEKSSPLPATDFRLASSWYIDFVIQHVPGERKACYTMRLAQSDNYGLACDLTSERGDSEYTQARREYDSKIVGEDSRQILREKRFRDALDRVALIDLVAGNVSATASDQVVLDRTLGEKYAVKSNRFGEEAEIALKKRSAIKGTKPRVVVIGAMAGTINELIRRGFEVSATDMDPGVVDHNLGGVKVVKATENDRLIREADLLIVTGMTLVNRTLPSVMEAAKINNTSTMIWAVTGKNLGPYYVEHGVDCVISDPSPFFYLPGPSSMQIWRREH
jgi:Putative heavy-metal chelation